MMLSDAVAGDAPVRAATANPPARSRPAPTLISDSGKSHVSQPQSLRAKLVERRTYLRPIDAVGAVFETKSQAVDRQINHQRYLWENAKRAQFAYLGDAEADARALLNDIEEAELAELRALIESRKVSLSGRVKWMADTDVIRERPAAAFNCSFTNVELPADFVDAFWLLLQGCGVGFRPLPGMLSGFSQSMEIEVIGSTRTERGGRENTVESFDGRIWTLSFGDSAKAWAKGLGKLMAHKYRAEKLVLDFSELRPAGQRLRGYGWISSGWEPFANGLRIIAAVMNARAGARLTAIDIGDIMNALGTVLSSRRSAQIWLLDQDHAEVPDFIHAKDGIYSQGGRYWREQSNNSIAFTSRPSRELLHELLQNVLMGGEPGLYNLGAAKKRAPWAKGTNPCAEIILPSKGFCNLAQVVWSRFNHDWNGLVRATEIMARANYRQTLVDMRDGVLQLAWHDNNKLLRLCGVSPTGVVGSTVIGSDVAMQALHDVAVDAANAMADQLGENRPALVTQVQPAGTSSKVLGEEGDEVQEGAHISPSRFVFNNVNFSRHDPIVDKARAARYKVVDHPTQPASVIVTMPVAYPASPLYRKRTTSAGEVIEVSTETALDQLERYRRLMKFWVDHNCSITISFDADEIDDIVNWIFENWDTYVGVSFMRRNDPTKTAEDLGFAYLPQEAVSEERYRSYVASLLPIDLEDDGTQDGVDDLTACSAGSCPIK